MCLARAYLNIINQLKQLKLFAFVSQNCRQWVHKWPLYNVLKGNVVLQNISAVTNTYTYVLYLFLAISITTVIIIYMSFCKVKCTQFNHFKLQWHYFWFLFVSMLMCLVLHNIRVLSTFEWFLQSNYLINDELTTGHPWSSSRGCKFGMDILLFRTS